MMGVQRGDMNVARSAESFGLLPFGATTAICCSLGSRSLIGRTHSYLLVDALQSSL